MFAQCCGHLGQNSRLVLGGQAQVIAALELIEGQNLYLGGLIWVDANSFEALARGSHGNADEMRTPDGSPVTRHSLNPVPIVAVGRAVAGRRLHDGVLADVAPTILQLAELPGWPEISGRSLLE